MAEAVGDVKTCTKCGVEKPLDGFNRSKQGKHGRRSDCRECSRSSYAEWRVGSCEARRVYMTEWHAANPHAQWESSYRQRSRRSGFKPFIDSFTKGDLIDRYGDQCFHCSDGEFEEIDHHPVPVSRGGRHTIENCKPSCTPCNRKSWRES